MEGHSLVEEGEGVGHFQVGQEEEGEAAGVAGRFQGGGEVVVGVEGLRRRLAMGEEEAEEEAELLRGLAEEVEVAAAVQGPPGLFQV